MGGGGVCKMYAWLKYRDSQKKIVKNLEAFHTLVGMIIVVLGVEIPEEFFGEFQI